MLDQDLGGYKKPEKPQAGSRDTLRATPSPWWPPWGRDLGPGAGPWQLWWGMR